ncbi:MAG: YebC/PmpR family DNA-binding transcriptional regulator [Candidatus Dependentiae bacterium]|nr:YebC/PmpR family DNA-binding transcriptional regulator [Candidatus Dependentiae bacterium]
MSGHNKWSQIKHKKAKEDGKRGQAFTKLIKEITEAAREGGGDPDGNPRLRFLLEKGRDVNMPIDNATRAIKRGTGELPGVSYIPLTYEGYGPYGMAVIIETLTDNKNRTVASLRHLCTTKGGSLGETGSVSWMFEKMGVIHGSGAVTEDQLLELLIDFSIHDIKVEDNSFAVFCDPKSVDQVRTAIKNGGLLVESAEFEWVPKTTVALADEQAEQAIGFLSAIQDLEDVRNVYANLA